MISVEKIADNELRHVILSLTAAAGKEVAVAGSFNDWDPDLAPMLDDGSGTYKVELQLAPGYYEYKFVIDGEWVLDDTNPNFAPNDFGTLNSVLSFD